MDKVALKARAIVAWGAAPGDPAENVCGLKARAKDTRKAVFPSVSICRYTLAAGKAEMIPFDGGQGKPPKSAGALTI